MACLSWTHANTLSITASHLTLPFSVPEIVDRPDTLQEQLRNWHKRRLSKSINKLTQPRTKCDKLKVTRSLYHLFFFFVSKQEPIQPEFACVFLKTTLPVFHRRPLATFYLVPPPPLHLPLYTTGYSFIICSILQFAVKMITKKSFHSAKEQFHIQREIDIQSKLRHPHIISVYKGLFGCYPMKYCTGWPLVWHTWKCQGIWQLSGKCQGFC